MYRRATKLAMPLAWMVLAVGWLVTGCGGAPTGPSSQGGISIEASADVGGTSVLAAPSGRVGPRGERVGVIRAERRVGNSDVEPDGVRFRSRAIPEALTVGRDVDLRSRYALARTGM